MRKKITDLIAWALVAAAAFSCRSPQELMQKAIDKDTEIVQQYADTITLTKIQVDSVQVQVGDTVIWEKILTEVEYDTIIPTFLIEIERAKTRQEIRKAAKLDKIRLKLEAKLAAQQAKYQKQIDKLSEKLKSKENKQENRLESREKRSNKFWWGFLLGVLSTLGVIFGIRWLFHKAISVY